MNSTLHFESAVNHWHYVVRVYDFHQRIWGTYFTVFQPLFWTYLKRETQTKLSLGNIDIRLAGNSFTRTWWYSKEVGESHILHCLSGWRGWRGDVHLDVFFCTALPRFMFVLISGSLKTKWKFVSAVSGSREGGLLLLQQKPGATCGAMAGTPGTHLGQPQGASGGQPKVQTLKWVHSDKAAVQVRVRSSDDDECQIQFHAHSDKCKVKLGLHSLGWGLHQQGPQPRHRHGCDGAAGGDCSGTAQAGTRDLGLSWNERSQLRLVRAVKPC